MFYYIGGALTAQLQDVGSGAFYCSHIAFVGVIVICLFLVGACSAFCSSGSVAMACLLLLVVLLDQRCSC